MAWAQLHPKLTFNDLSMQQPITLSLKPHLSGLSLMDIFIYSIINIFWFHLSGLDPTRSSSVILFLFATCHNYDDATCFNTLEGFFINFFVAVDVKSRNETLFMELIFNAFADFCRTIISMVRTEKETKQCDTNREDLCLLFFWYQRSGLWTMTIRSVCKLWLNRVLKPWSCSYFP